MVLESDSTRVDRVVDDVRHGRMDEATEAWIDYIHAGREAQEDSWVIDLVYSYDLRCDSPSFARLAVAVTEQLTSEADWQNMAAGPFLDVLDSQHPDAIKVLEEGASRSIGTRRALQMARAYHEAG